MGACDYTDGGNNLEDAVYAAKAFEAAGVDLLDISGSFYGYTNPMTKDEGYFKEASQAIKSHVSIPVILTGGIRSLETAESILEDGYSDMVGIGRPIFKDSNWIEKNLNNTLK